MGRKNGNPEVLLSHASGDSVWQFKFEAAAPNQQWVGDTTEFIIGGSGKLYLAAILDLCSRFIVG